MVSAVFTSPDEADWTLHVRSTGAQGIGYVTSFPSPPQIHPSDPYRFLVDGSVWYPSGYYPALSTFNATSKVTSEYYREYIDDIAANGLNYTRMISTMGQGYYDGLFPYERTGPGTAADGDPKFDLNNFSEAFFSYWDDVLTYANSKGVVVQLCIWDGWHNHKFERPENESGNSWGMKYDFYRGENNVNGVDADTQTEWTATSGSVWDAQSALARKMVEELGQHKNLIWEVGNEIFPVADPGHARGQTWQKAMADVMSQREGQIGVETHLIMPRDLPGHELVGSKMGDNIDRSEIISHRSYNQPVILDNDWQIDPYTVEFRKDKAWVALTAGEHVNFFHFDTQELSVLTSANAQNGMRAVASVANFLEKSGADLVGMVPQDDLVSRGWAYGRAGDEMIVYLEGGGSVTINGLPENYVARWYDPDADQLILAGSEDGSGGSSGEPEPTPEPEPEPAPQPEPEPAPPSSSGEIGAAGTVSVAQSGSGQWHSIQFAEALDDPSVVMGPLSDNGWQPATVRVRNVTSQGFEFQIDEWDYLDGRHKAETLSWLAVEAGTHQLANGMVLLAGSTTGDDAPRSVGFGGRFDAAPVVLAQAVSANGSEAIATRLEAVSADGFRFRFQDEEAGDGSVANEELDWIAIETGAKDGIFAETTGDVVTHNPHAVSFGDAFAGTPALFAAMQSFDGPDSATVRAASLSQQRTNLFVEEEVSLDNETRHTSEKLGILAIEDGFLLQ